MTDSIELAMSRTCDYSSVMSVDRSHRSKAHNKHTPDALPDNIVADNHVLCSITLQSTVRNGTRRPQNYVQHDVQGKGL